MKRTEELIRESKELELIIKHYVDIFYITTSATDLTYLARELQIDKKSKLITLCYLLNLLSTSYIKSISNNNKIQNKPREVSNNNLYLIKVYDNFKLIVNDNIISFVVCARNEEEARLMFAIKRDSIKTIDIKKMTCEYIGRADKNQSKGTIIHRNKL